MGNFFAKKDELILDFGGLKTENISSTIPYMNKLNADSQSLVDRLNIKQSTHPVKAKVFTESENYDMYKLFEKTQGLDNNDNNFSDTSPFITSDLYKNLIKTQKGGKKMSSDSDDDSSTSSSSSSSSSSGMSHEKKNKKKRDKKSSDDDSDDDFDDLDKNDMSSSNNSYVSSTAHTDGINSNNSNVSSELSTVSLKKNKHKSRLTPDSINTSDINMISVEE